MMRKDPGQDTSNVDRATEPNQHHKGHHDGVLHRSIKANKERGVSQRILSELVVRVEDAFFKVRYDTLMLENKPMHHNEDCKQNERNITIEHCLGLDM